MACRFTYTSKALVGVVDRRSGSWVADEVERQLNTMRKTMALPVKAMAWATLGMDHDEEVSLVYANCTEREQPVLEDVVANCW